MAVSSHTTVFVFANFSLDPERRLLMRGDEPVALHPKAFELLLMLIENSDRVLTKNEILNTIWEGQFVEENNLAVQISALRKVFGETGKEHRFIVTLPGRGYRFVSPVGYEKQKPATAPAIESEKSNGSAPTSLHQPLTQAVAEARPSQKKYFFWLGLGVLLLGASLGLLFWRGLLASSSQQPVLQIASARRVTNTGKVRTAALSPDGKLFLYSSGKRNETGLWLGHVDGGDHIQLRAPADAKYRGLAFAPDGESVYYVVAEEHNPNGALYRSSILGGVPEKLREIVNTQIAIAPGGKQFAYVRSDSKENRSSLLVADLAGANEREIASRPSDQSFEWQTPSWSPDGKLISVAAAAGAPKGLELFVVTVEDGAVKQLTSESKWDTVSATEWLKNDSGLLVVASEKAEWADSQIYYVSYPDGVVRHVNPDLIAYGNSLKLASDNRTLLTTQVQRSTNIWIAPAHDLAQARQVTFGSLERLDGMLDLSWTPDRKLLHSAIVDHAVTLWKTDPNAGKQQQLTSSSSFNHRLSMTQDERFLVFESNRSGSPEIWRSNPAGDDTRQLTSSGENSWPHVSPDGRWIVFRKRDGFLWRMTIDGTDELRLSEQPASSPRFSPDGGYVACIYNGDDRERIAVLSVDGGPPIKLFDAPVSANFNLGVRWIPDGKALTYRDWGHAIWRQDLDGGEPHRLPGLPTEPLYAYDWSPDGKELAFTRGSHISDIVLITLGPSSPR